MLTGTSSLALVLGAFACAAGDEPDASDPTFLPPPSPPSSLPDAGAVADADTEDVQLLPPQEGCSDDGFCYFAVPSNDALCGVSASGVDDAWMVSASALFHWDGAAIRRVFDYEVAPPTTVSLTEVVARKRDDVWAVGMETPAGSGVVVRYAPPVGGGAPSFRTLRADWGRASLRTPIWGPATGGEIWAATFLGRVYRIREDATGAVVEDLSPVPAAADTRGYFWNSVWGFSATEVYVAGMACATPATCTSSNTQGTQGVIARYDGTSWTFTPIATSIAVGQLYGTPPGVARQLRYQVQGTGTASREARLRRAELVTVEADGSLGPIVESTAAVDLGAVNDSCGLQSPGSLTASGAGWGYTDSAVCRWSGQASSVVATAVGRRPIMRKIESFWTDGTDDLWVVGRAFGTATFLPPFAARRVAATAAE